MADKYLHGGDIFGFTEKYGRVPLDFSSNINPLGMPETVRNAYIAAFGDCAAYPDSSCRALRRKIAEYENINADAILCGNGAADLIFRIVYTLKPQRALLPVPSFAEYEKALHAVHTDIDYFYFEEKSGFNLTYSLLDKIAGHDILFLCNPNNPTGCVTEHRLLLDILHKCRQMGTFVIIDECFLGFTDELSVCKYIAEFHNVAVIKAFTKLYAMPGLRLGYMLTYNDTLLNNSGSYTQAWSVSAPAIACGIAALDATDYTERTKEYVAKERGFLINALEQNGAKVYGSYANYIFFRHDRKELAEQFAANGILIRSCSNYEGLGACYYRVAVRTHSDNAEFIKILEKLTRR